MITFFKAKKGSTNARELTSSEMELVSGGLNPQPLPPKVFSAFSKYVNPAQTAGFEYGGLRASFGR